MPERLTPEQQKQRDKASELSFEAAQISQLLKSGANIPHMKRKRLESRRDELIQEARRIKDTLPRVDPWGNIKP